MLYDLLTNKLPFHFTGLNAMQAGEMVWSKEPAKPSTINARIAGLTRRSWDDLDVLVLKAMHKDVGQRYGTVDGLIRDIHHFLADEPLDARPDSTKYLVSKFLRRNQRNVALIGAVICFIFGLSGFFLFSITRARNAAQEEASRTRRVTEFTRTMLSGDDADNGPSKDMKVIDMLGLALTRAKSLDTDPTTQAELYTTLGSLYTYLGNYGKADEVLHSACGILAQRAPVSHEMSEALLQLGVLYAVQSNDKRSLACMSKALAVEQQVKPIDRALLFRSRNGIAYALLESDPKSAAAALADLLNEPAGNTTEEERSDVWQNLATAYINLGEYAKAEPYERKVLAYSRRTRPATHPDISGELINLSIIEREQAHYAAAEQDLREALAINSAWFPKGHGQIGDVQRMLASVLFLEKRYDEAIPLAREALITEERSYGSSNRKTAYAIQIVGVLDLKRGNAAEAVSLFQREIATLKSLNDPTNLPRALGYLGDAYAALRRYPLSEEAYRSAMRSYDSSFVPALSRQAETNRKLGEVLMKQGRYSDAEPPLLKSYSVWTSNPSSPSDEVRLTRENLVRVYKALRRKAEEERFEREIKASIQLEGEISSNSFPLP